MKLPPLATAASPIAKPAAAATAADKPNETAKSSLEAMIMSIPILNKIKILSAVSPSLANPHPTSPPLTTRGAVVAVEGSDLASVWSMTTSLRSQLEKDGKFVVKVFTGPDPSSFFGGGADDTNGKVKPSRGSLNTADVLRLVGEWHKLSDEMRPFITSRPGQVVDADEQLSEEVVDVEMSSEDDPQATVPVPTQAPEQETTDNIQADDTTAKATKNPERVTFDLPSDGTEIAEPIDASKGTSPRSSVSPQTLSKTSDLTINTPPITRSMSRSEDLPINPPPSATKLDTFPPPSPSKLPAPAATSVPAHPTTPPTAPVTMPARPSLVSAAPIPIALIPSYQLSTSNYCAINTAISDSYSPGSHWQWVAALWRGAIGPDVTIAIRGVPAPGAADDTASEPPLSDERMPGHRTGMVEPLARDRQASLTVNTGVRVPVKMGQGQGVEVRLLDYRAVVVRMVQVEKEKGGQSEEERKAEEFWEKAKRRVGFEVAEFLRR